MMKRISLVLVIALLGSWAANAQKDKKELPKNWYQLDQKETGVYGISLDKAYAFLKSKKAKSKTVTVAVIDSGIDTLQEDLKSILWINPKEIPGNGVDDDHNGFIDDIHGWNFIGGKDGTNVKEDSYEMARVYHQYKDRFSGHTEGDFSGEDKNLFLTWKKAEKKLVTDASSGGVDFVLMERAYKSLVKSDSILQSGMGKEVYTGNELDAYETKTAEEKRAKSAIYGIMKENGQTGNTNKEFMSGFADFIAGEKRKDEAKNTPPPTYRKDVVKDDETNLNDRDYGNNDLMASTALHGTHCSGIIAAVRGNGKGMDGIADNVRIMMVRAVPDGDEHDKDISNAIRYAVDNGAQIISMSFGKDFSPQKKWVDDAFRYAESKGVLLVHAAGNDAKNVDKEDNFPSGVYIDGKGRAGNLITVGASGDPKNGGITASFSNYGKKEVDVFAPGVQIYSTLPGGNVYGFESGTSMACPVTAGIAALLLEYFPTLTAKQLKMVIEKSAQKPDIKVNIPGTSELTDLADLCVSGGLVNAYEAVKLAATIKGERKQTVTVLPKPKLIRNKKG